MDPATPAGPAEADRPVTATANRPAPATAVAPLESQGLPTRVYWWFLLLALLFLALAAMFRQDAGDFGTIGFGITAVATGIVILIATIGLIRRGHVIQRAVRGTAGLAHGVAEGARRRSDANEGAWERFVDGWRLRFERFGRFLLRVVRWPIRLTLWIIYTVEKLIWWTINILYDVIYYPLYAAWIILLWALRVSGRILWFALGIVWKILKPLTYLPGVKKWWRNEQRPKILATWRNMKIHQRMRRQQRIEKGRRLAVLRGEDPDHWQREFQRRRGFPLRNPEKTRRSIRRRIAHIRAVQRARKLGKPVPRWKPKKAEQPLPPLESPPAGGSG